MGWRFCFFFFFSSRRRHTRFKCDWSSDVCSSDLLVQSPADTEADLQIICLFRSDNSNTLHGSLIETNEKLKGLLDRIRKPSLFGGELGETLLLQPTGSLTAKRVLMVSLGDSQTFTPERME